MLGGKFLNKVISKSNFQPELISYFNSADCIITNFENTVGTTKNYRKDKDSLLFCNFKTLKSYIKIFPKSIFNLGNNHISDFGNEGFKKTIKRLDELNIKYFGAGYKNEFNNSFSLHDKCVILTFSTDETFVKSRIAQTNEIGITKYDLKNIKDELEKYEKNEIKVILLHWGYEYIKYPSPKQRELSKKIIDTGADLIIGTHPHIIQGYESYKGKRIYYSLGNFLFTDYYDKIGRLHKWNKENYYSIIVELKMNNDNSLIIQERGLYFNKNKLKLSFNEDSLKKLEKRSKKIEIKRYNQYLKIHSNKKSNRKSFFLIKYINLFIRKFDRMRIKDKLIAIKNKILLFRNEK